MLNEKKIRLMTKLALYEKNDGKESSKARKWFRADYISREMLVSFICATIAFVLIFFLYAVYNLEPLLTAIYSRDIFSFVRRFLFAYILFLAAFLLITGLVYSYRFNRARRRLRAYYRGLRKLSQMYGDDGSENK